jgi:hypothetical protein
MVTIGTWQDVRGHRWPRPDEEHMRPSDRCTACALLWQHSAIELECDQIMLVSSGPVTPSVGSAFEQQWGKFESFARETFESDLIRAREKAMEYGSHDLEIMAVAMEGLLPEGQLDPQSRHAVGIEMAIAFYLMGKAARMFGAFKKGTAPGNDSWRDGSIYSMMARYVRTNGRWIG